MKHKGYDHSLGDVAEGAGLGLQQFELVHVHHLLLGGDEVQLEGGFEVEQLPQHHEEQQLVRQGLDALHRVHELDGRLLGVLQHLPDDVLELLLVLLGVLGLVLRQDADEQLLVGAIFSDDCLVEGF